MRPSILLYYKSAVFFIAFIFVISTKLFAQYPAAWSLYFNPSPKSNGLGMTGTSLPSDEPFAFYYNPAQLGYSSQSNYFSLEFYPSNIRYFNTDFYSYRNTAVSFGYNFKDLLNGFNFSAGFGYIYSEFSSPSYFAVSPIAQTGNFDKLSSYALGIGINYYIQLSAGINFKQISSASNWSFGPEASYGNADLSAIDYGLLLYVPILKLLAPKYSFSLGNYLSIYPNLNISLGYAKLNYGGDVHYSLNSYSQPLPRDARLGYSIAASFGTKLNSEFFKLFGYFFTADVDDYLIKQTEVPPYFSYQSGIGDIQIGRNLIDLKGDSYVVVHKGNEFDFLETFTYLIGRFSGRNDDNNSSNGFGFQTKGLFKLIKSFSNNTALNYIADHVNIKYYSSIIYENDPRETKFEGFDFTFSNFKF